MHYCLRSSPIMQKHLPATSRKALRLIDMLSGICYC